MPEISGADSLQVTSSAFGEGDRIPTEFTCEGEDVAPPLSWDAVEGAAQYAIGVTDPDAPSGTFLHWLVYGIPGDTTELERGRLPDDVIQLANDFGKSAYGGPCPPPGKPHRYFFTVYAVSSPPQQSNLDARGWLDSIKPDVIATGQLMGTYGR